MTKYTCEACADTGIVHLGNGKWKDCGCGTNTYEPYASEEEYLADQNSLPWKKNVSGFRDYVYERLKRSSFYQPGKPLGEVDHLIRIYGEDKDARCLIAVDVLRAEGFSVKTSASGYMKRVSAKNKRCVSLPNGARVWAVNFEGAQELITPRDRGGPRAYKKMATVSWANIKNGWKKDK